jgi:hypothetical protein
MLRMRQKAARREVQGAVLAPLSRDRPLPLSFGQQRMWLVDRWQPGNPAYNLPFAYRISGGLDREALQWAFGEIVRRHEILRTAVVQDGDEPAQVVRPHELFPLPRVDLSGLPEAVRLPVAQQLAAEESREPFDLERGPFRAVLLSLGPRDEALVTVVHHIAADAWSLTIFQRELTALYAARRPAVAGNGDPGARCCRKAGPGGRGGGDLDRRHRRRPRLPQPRCRNRGAFSPARRAAVLPHR